MDDWTKCVQWLVRVGMLPGDHRLATPAAQLAELAYLLRDGVLLCRLLNQLRPRTINTKDFSQRPQTSQFLCMKNANVFLNRCKTVFKMRDSDLFSPEILYSMESFGDVLKTLSILSNTAEAQKSNVPPFTLQNSSNFNNNNSIKDYINCTINDDDYMYDYVRLDEDEDDVYGTLMDFHKSQSSNSPTLSNGNREHPKVVKEMVKSIRDHCIDEMVETEKKYVEALQMIVKHFMQPLKTFLSSIDYDTIFFGIEKLLSIHEEFYSLLLRASKNEGNFSIPDCFVTSKEKFLYYGEFCCNLSGAQARLDAICQQNPVLQQNIMQCERIANQGRFRLGDLLAVPMQRVLKYHLLLKELIKHTNHTNDTDEGRKSLKCALDETQDLSLFVNEVKRDYEILDQIQSLQNSITDLPLGTILKEYGRCIKDGEARVKTPLENAPHQRHLFLFDKVLIICKRQGETYSFKNLLDLSDCTIDDSMIKEKSQFGFSLESNRNREKFVIYAKTIDLRNKWIEAIKMSKDNICPPYAVNDLHDFVMFSFGKTTICDVCRKLLRGTFYQGYKCRRTQMAVHKECLEKSQKMIGPPEIVPRRTSGKSSVRRGSDVTVPKPPFNGNITRSPSLNIPVPVANSNRKPQQPPLCTRQAPSDYVNAGAEHGLLKYPWFVGEMSREDATRNLEPMPEGCYLVRISVNDTRKGGYSLSVKADDSIKQMKIYNLTPDSWYLVRNKTFPNIVELIEYYQQISLEKLFPEVKTPLRIPLREGQPMNIVGYCKAEYDYAPRELNHLSIKTGDEIAILSKAGEAKGWWKGYLRGKVGYFPTGYVTETTPDFEP